MTAPLYPVNTPQNGISQGLFPFKVNAEFFKEWVQLTLLEYDGHRNDPSNRSSPNETR